MSNYKGYFYARDIGTNHTWGKTNGDIYNTNLGGKVGVNITNPTYTLDVNGNTNIRGNLYINGTAIDLSGSSTDLSGYVRNPMRSNLDASGFNVNRLNTVGFLSGSSIIQGVTFDLSLNEQLRVNNNGLVVNKNNRVGVNTNNPGYTLDVSGDSNIKGNLYISGSVLNVSGTSIDLSGYVRNPMRSHLDASGFNVNRLNTVGFLSGSSIIQGVTFDLSLNEQLRVNNNGLVVNKNNRVGVNTNNPGYTLDVSGDTNIRGKLYFDGLVADLCGVAVDLTNYVKNPLDRTFDISKNTLLNIGILDFGSGLSINVDNYPGSFNGKIPIYTNSYGTHPMSIMRTTYITSDISYNVLTAGNAIIRFDKIYSNQLHLDISNSLFKIPTELSGQFIEVYLTVQMDTGSNNNILTSTDISCTQCTFKHTFDMNQTYKSGVYTLVYGPHIIRPDEYDLNNRYAINLKNESVSSANFKVLRSDILFRSYIL